MWRKALTLYGRKPFCTGKRLKGSVFKINIRKNQIIGSLAITDITSDGSGVGHYETEEGRIAVFVSGAVPGDVIRCKVVKVLKKCLFGIIDELTIPSPDREDRGCTVKKSCGGCVFRHISYEAETRIKENIVRNAFVRIGGFSETELRGFSILGCKETDRYRNKAQYPIASEKNGELFCGFYAPRSHRIIPCGDCLLQPRIFSDILGSCLELLKKNKLTAYNEESGRGFIRHIYIRQGFRTGEIMVCFVAARNAPDRLAPAANELMERFPDIKSVILNVNDKKTNVIMGEKSVVITGENGITDVMCGNKIFLSPESFYQINTAQAERLYFKAAEYASLTGNEEVLDLYCGAGTIGLSLAGRAKHITGAEIIPEAVENARSNAAANNIKNADFICADAGQAAEMLAADGISPDVIITDPPRKGCDEKTLSAIVRMSPKRIVMISCNPATAARDCRFLVGQGYTLAKINAVDMFPAAGHVETVVLMSRLKD